MYKTFQIRGRRYKIKTARAREAAMNVGAFLFLMAGYIAFLRVVFSYVMWCHY